MHNCSKLLTANDSNPKISNTPIVAAAVMRSSSTVAIWLLILLTKYWNSAPYVSFNNDSNPIIACATLKDRVTLTSPAVNWQWQMAWFKSLTVKPSNEHTGYKCTFSSSKQQVSLFKSTNVKLEACKIAAVILNTSWTSLLLNFMVWNAAKSPEQVSRSFTPSRRVMVPDELVNLKSSGFAVGAKKYCDSSRGDKFPDNNS